MKNLDTAKAVVTLHRSWKNLLQIKEKGSEPQVVAVFTKKPTPTHVLLALRQNDLKALSVDDALKTCQIEGEGGPCIKTLVWSRVQEIDIADDSISTSGPRTCPTP